MAFHILADYHLDLQVDAHLSYDTNATYEKAMRLMELYSKKGVDPK